MLTLEGCRARQERFLKTLDAARLGGALISHPRDIYYFTGLWVEDQGFGTPSLLFLGPGRASWLATWREDGSAVAEVRERYPRSLLETVNPDNHRRLGNLADSGGRRYQGLRRIGYQAEGGAKFAIDRFLAAAGVTETAIVDDFLTEQQLRKDSDEVAALRVAAEANVAAYQRAAEIIQPGMSELEVLTECQQAAILAAGEPAYYGGDFRCGETGGPARPRKIVAGEVYIIDAQVDVQGYWSDMARAWVVGGEPTDLQQSVYEHLAEILDDVPSMVRPGLGCLEIWKEIDCRIREHVLLGDHGLTHHGGHGIGLRAHEGPDLSWQRDATFEVGNVFAIEPGVYIPELRSGIRLEDNFVLTENGVERLPAFVKQFVPLSRRPPLKSAKGKG